MDEKEAKEVLENERRARVEACKEEINIVLEKFKCRLDVAVILRAGQVIPQIDIISME